MNKTQYNSIDSSRFFLYLITLSLLAQVLLQVIFVNYQSNAVTFWIVNGLYSLCLGGAALLYSKFKGAHIKSAMRFHRAPGLLHTGLLLLIIFILINVMTPVNEWFLNLIESMGFNRPAIGVSDKYIYDYLIMAIIFACIVPAFTEELAFRGVIGNGLLASYKPLPAILISGLLFSIFHLNPAQTLHQFALGCILTLFVMRSGSLWVAIIGHFFNNLLAILLGIIVEPTGFYSKYAVWIVVVGVPIVIALIALYCIVVRSNTALSYDEKQSRVVMSIKDKILFVAGFAVVVALWIINLVGAV